MSNARITFFAVAGLLSVLILVLLGVVEYAWVAIPAAGAFLLLAPIRLITFACMRDKSRRQQLRWWRPLSFATAVSGMVGAPCFLFAALILGPTTVEHLTRRDFDSVTWKANPVRTNEKIRQRMVDNLLVSRVLVGKSRAEILALLGPSDVESYDKARFLAYALGSERSVISIDSELLLLQFDTENRCRLAQLVTD